MGNKPSNKESKLFVRDIDADRFRRKYNTSKCRQFLHERHIEEVVVPDWEDDDAVHHRSAMNSLHNYAVGKMPSEESSVCKTSDPKKKWIKKSPIRFAEVLENTMIVNRSALCMESKDFYGNNENLGILVESFEMNERT